MSQILEVLEEIFKLCKELGKVKDAVLSLEDSIDELHGIPESYEDKELGYCDVDESGIDSFKKGARLVHNYGGRWDVQLYHVPQEFNLIPWKEFPEESGTPFLKIPPGYYRCHFFSSEMFEGKYGGWIGKLKADEDLAKKIVKLDYLINEFAEKIHIYNKDSPRGGHS